MIKSCIVSLCLLLIVGLSHAYDLSNSDVGNAKKVLKPKEDYEFEITPDNNDPLCPGALIKGVEKDTFNVDVSHYT